MSTENQRSATVAVEAATQTLSAETEARLLEAVANVMIAAEAPPEAIEAKKKEAREVLAEIRGRLAKTAKPVQGAMPACGFDTIRLTKQLLYDAHSEVEYPDNIPISSLYHRASSRREAEYTIDVKMVDLPSQLVEYLLKGGYLPDDDHQKLLHYYKSFDIEADLLGPMDFSRAMTVLQARVGTGVPYLCRRVGGNWYPVRTTVRALETFFGYITSLRCYLKIGDQVVEEADVVTERQFLDNDGHAAGVKLTALLDRAGYRLCTAEDIATASHKAAVAASFNRPGMMLSAAGPGLEVSKIFWFTVMDQVALGTPELPQKVIYEPELDTQADPYASSDRNQSQTELPMVRVFDLNRRGYLYCDPLEVTPYRYDDTVLDRLQLEPRHEKLLKSAFASGAAHLTKDLVSGQHGGLLVLASGSPGTGKTLTARVFAEHTHRPLYEVSLADLGDSLESVEDNLKKIFLRATRWNAMLLLDECDIFLKHRGDDLTRDAIVGIFLRALDYFPGFLFLTSNLPKILDRALLSRVTLHLKYPDLNAEKKIRIWRSLLDIAGFKFVTGDFSRLGEVELDGRKIRNCVRLARQVSGDAESVAVDELLELVQDVADVAS